MNERQGLIENNCRWTPEGNGSNVESIQIDKLTKANKHQTKFYWAILNLNSLRLNQSLGNSRHKIFNQSQKSTSYEEQIWIK